LQNNIGIAGFGFVGSALYNAISDKTKVKIYDPGFEEFSYQKGLLDTNVVFICVGTPMSYDGLDSTAINDNIKFLSDNDYEGIVVIKSTCLPEYLADYEKLKILANPEFLDEVTSYKDFENQKLLLIGGRIDLCHELKDIYDTYFNITYNNIEFVRFEEALQFKYLRNIKIAYDVMFYENVNFTVKNYRKYLTIMDKLPVKISRIRADGKPGYGGHCLPKDIHAFNYVYKDKVTKYLKDFNEIRFTKE